MYIDERLLREIQELDSLIGESVLLTPTSRSIFRTYARSLQNREELDTLKNALSGQKQFILDYLRKSLHDDALAGDASWLMNDMRSAYLRKLHEEEKMKSREEKSDISALLGNLCLATI